MIVCMQWAILEPLSVATDKLQASKTVTASLVLPLVSKLAVVSDPDHMAVDITGCQQFFSQEMIAVRQDLHDDIKRRYLVDLAECKLEDHIVALMCDPR